ncbi:MAG: hypothetical protein QME94_18710 [Anaerolineae bacterium]|nr:hypothetical protein [Anaerolineae bacterium]
MSRRAVGITLLALGPVVLLVALVADLVGLGSGASIAHQQLAGAAAGVAITVGGAALRAVG